MNDSMLVYVLVVNIFTLFLMRIDKQKAIKQQFRIPERTFFLLSFLGGALGTYIGMQLFRHKTKHASFTVGIPVLIIWNAGAFIYLFVNMS
ncbi:MULTISPECIES: DUF1294 domain-containing protein [Oceanobacillus]|uniref:DUF1294 domain-containing protein n=1 Tax=Oceanobacillus indicireducens TaxID=1004261 RepID=A0A917XY60_9BACI|nr:DUF1294 domain-containing protein [Oceanobacillus indicireducens]GGN58335.1 hypothetical protein GCM10007971_20270 [Oceanobacillus indicireducens]